MFCKRDCVFKVMKKNQNLKLHFNFTHFTCT